MSALPELLTAADLGERLNQSSRWVYRRQAEDGLPAIRVGRALYFDPSQVLDWLDAHRTHDQNGSCHVTQRSGPPVPERPTTATHQST